MITSLLQISNGVLCDFFPELHLNSFSKSILNILTPFHSISNGKKNGVKGAHSLKFFLVCVCMCACVSYAREGGGLGMPKAGVDPLELESPDTGTGN